MTGGFTPGIAWGKGFCGITDVWITLGAPTTVGTGTGAWTICGTWVWTICVWGTTDWVVTAGTGGLIGKVVWTNGEGVVWIGTWVVTAVWTGTIGAGVGTNDFCAYGITLGTDTEVVTVAGTGTIGAGVGTNDFCAYGITLGAVTVVWTVLE